MRMKASRIIGHRKVPRMAARMLARAILVRRQRDGLAAWLAGAGGGRVRDLPGTLFGDQEDNQSCVDPSSCEIGLLGSQFVEAGEALHPFEGEFDLPAEAIEREHVGGMLHGRS